MQVYVDNAASTPTRQEVLDIMQSNQDNYGNPSSIHSLGKKSRELIENARNQIAKSINAKPSEIIFTSSGTEADNLAIQGFAEANSNRGYHIITTAIEHASVLKPLRYLYQQGYDITYLPVDNKGLIDLQQLRKSIRRNTILISIIFANNEIGTIQPIKEIGSIARQYNIPFHTDAVQAFGHLGIDVNELNIDMMSISGHKIYAPKGIGALYAKEDIDLSPIIFGGGQEFGLRSGTENVNSIVGMGKAVELLDTEKNDIAAHLEILKNDFINGIMEITPNVKFNGSQESSLHSIVNLSFDGIQAETLLTMLDLNGICASNGSACHSGSLKPSHVLKAIGLSDEAAQSSLRFSFGKYNTKSDIDYILNILPDLVHKIRKEML